MRRLLALTFLFALGALPAAPLSAHAGSADAVTPWAAASRTLPEPRVFVRTTALHEAWDFRGVGDDTLRRRRFTQQLEVHARSSADPAWQATLLGAYTFDAARGRRSGDPLNDELQLEPTLHVAHVTWRPHSALGLTLGRHLLSSPLGLARIDGASLSFQPPQGPTIALAAGLRPQDTLWRLNDWSYQPDGDDDLRGTLDGAALLLEARAGYRHDLLALEAGVRQERAFDGSRRYDERIHAGTRLGPVHTPHVRTHVRYSTLYRLVDDAALRALFPLDDTWTLESGALLRRPIFPLDSPFSIFPLSSHADLYSGARWDPSGPHSAGVDFFVRSWSEDERAMPFVDAPGPPLLGTTLDHRWRPSGPLSLSSRASLAADLDDERRTTRLTLHQAAAWRIGPRGPDLQGSLTGLWYRDQLRPTHPRGGAAVAGLGALFAASPWADLSLMTWSAIDSRAVGTFRLLLLADIRLPGVPR